MSSNLGQHLDQRIAGLERELAFAREGQQFALDKIDALRARLNLPGLCSLEIGDPVEHVSGDFAFRGTVVGVFARRKGSTLAAVENADGLVLLFDPKELHRLGESA